ncbi:MAG TPA: hypothetical protein VFW98_17690 [Gemmatimonadaceae bacterium]|nr:hypothetical protein [Gemmatimonadaceae bacterium]
MILETGERIAQYLQQHHHFSECVLEDIRWLHYGTSIELVFDYIWTQDGELRSDTTSPEIEALRFLGVQEFSLKNALNEAISLQPAEVNWGLSEIAMLQLVDDETLLAKYKSLPIPVHHVRCSWESDRQIDIVFTTVEVD